jgi:DNA polymerase-1
MTNRYLLIDGNNVLMRAIYGTQHSGMSHHGVPTGAITAFINSIAHLIRDERPTHVAVAWDAVGDTHRHALSSDYKANRRKGPIAELKEAAFPLARRFLNAAHIDQELHDGWEADDIIAAWWRMIELETADDRVIIASSDKDFIQLLGANPRGVDTELVRLSSADTPTDRWDLDRVQQNGHEPEHWPMITALTGDPSDNVIGIDGIGPVKARKLLDRNDWDLERALQEIPEHADKVRLNYALVNLRDAAPGTLYVLPPGPVMLAEAGSLHGKALEAFLTQYGLNGALRRFKDGELWTPPKPKKIPGRPLPLF